MARKLTPSDLHPANPHRCNERSIGYAASNGYRFCAKHVPTMDERAWVNGTVILLFYDDDGYRCDRPLGGRLADPPRRYLWGHPRRERKQDRRMGTVTYQERLERKAERLRAWAESRERKAQEARDASHAAVERIPMGQPVLMGHHSQKAHEKAINRSWDKLGQSIEHQRKAEDFERRADHAEKHAQRITEAIQNSAEDYHPGEIVRARFTNSGRIHRFEGEIIERTLNFWKIRSITSPYDGQEPGVVFRIPCMGRKGYTANNRIEERA